MRGLGRECQRAFADKCALGCCFLKPPGLFLERVADDRRCCGCSHREFAFSAHLFKVFIERSNADIEETGGVHDHERHKHRAVEDKCSVDNHQAINAHEELEKWRLVEFHMTGIFHAFGYLIFLAFDAQLGCADKG